MTIRTLLIGAVLAGTFMAVGSAVGATGFAKHSAQSEEDAIPQVHGETLFDVQAFVPGELAHLIVLLDVPEHWHIYWANGGETGMPTTVEVTGPEGWKVGTPRFPGPTMYLDDQGNRSYVMEGQVGFFVPIVPSPDAVNGEVAEFKVNLDWLLCKDVCHSGGYQATVELPVAPNTPEWQMDPRIAPLRRALPLQGAAPKGVAVKLTGDGKEAKLSFSAKDQLEFEFFASPESPMEVAERGANLRSEHTSERGFRLEPALGQKPKQVQVKGVLRVAVKDQILYYELEYKGEQDLRPGQKPAVPSSPTDLPKQSPSPR